MWGPESLSDTNETLEDSRPEGRGENTVEKQKNYGVTFEKLRD